MRLIGLLITLTVIAYLSYTYLGSSSTSNTNEAEKKPAEYVDQAQQSVDKINDLLKKQQEQLQKNK